MRMTVMIDYFRSNSQIMVIRMRMIVMIDYFRTNNQIMMIRMRMIVMIVYLGQTARYLVYLSLPSPPQAQ